MALPSTYQEVEYIESSGTQYIKIGTQFKTSYKIVIDFQMTVIGGDYAPIGVRTADGGNKRYGIDAWNSYFKVIAGGGDWNDTIAEDTNRHTITLDKSIAIVDGTSYSVQYEDWTFNEGIGVFYYHRIGETPDCISSNKLYKLDIYDENGTHIYDLVPVVRKSDNKPGLYDLINNVFYTNQGTGEFGYPAQSGKIKKIYVGTNLVRPKAPAYSYSFDFTNKTLSACTNAGWYVTTGSFDSSFGSSGLHSGNVWSTIKYNTGVQLTNTSKITFITNCIGGGGYWTDISLGFNDGTNGFGVYWSGTYSGYSEFTYVGTNATDIPVLNGELTIYVDLSQKYVSCKIGNTTKTYSLTDSQVSTIVGTTQILTLTTKNNYVKDVSINIS